MERALSVVMVEDDPDHVWLLTSCLSRDDSYEIVGHADTADDAVRVVEQCQPHIVLLDLHLHQSSGTTSIPGIITVSPRTMVVAISATRNRDAREAALSAGAFAFVAKGPQLYDGTALTRALGTLNTRFREALDGGTYVAPIVVLDGDLPIAE